MAYTAFAYDHLTLDGLTPRVDVTNTGDRPGPETVQVYLQDVAYSVMTPVKRPIAYRQVELAPGEKRTLAIP